MTVAVTTPLLCSSKVASEPGPPVMGTGAADTTLKGRRPCCCTPVDLDREIRLA